MSSGITLVSSKWENGELVFYVGSTEIFRFDASNVKVKAAQGIVADVTGDITGDITGQVFGTATEYTALAPAIALTDTLVLLDGTSNGVAATLAAGTAGQRITVKAVNVDNAVTLVPAVFEDGTTITFGTVLDSIVLISDGTGWYIESNTGCEVA